MLNSILNTAKSAGGRLVDAVSDVNLGSIKGQATSAIGRAVDGVTDAADGILDRFQSDEKATIYDNALVAVADVLGGRAMIPGEVLMSVLTKLRENNPYR